MSENYYTILGVPSNATTNQIRDRFLQLAREQHPDRYIAEEKDEAEAQFQRVTQAYNVLVDPERRRQYDQELSQRTTRAATAVSGQAARVYIRRGVEAYKKKRYSQAVEFFEHATQDNPEDAQAWYYLARALNHRRPHQLQGPRPRLRQLKAPELLPRDLPVHRESPRRDDLAVRLQSVHHLVDLLHGAWH